MTLPFRPVTVLTQTETNLIERVGQQTKFKSCPPWLGKFEFKCYYNNLIRGTPLEPIVDRLRTLVPNQDFNTVFLQRYTEGSYVAEHRDPKNNIGVTIIAIAGSFTGAKSFCKTIGPYQLISGDVAIQDCTINGVQGPSHSVGYVLSGTRYALILNTIRG